MSSLSKCRVCFSKKLVEIGSLGDIAISNFTKKPCSGRKYPLTLVFCEDCTLLQLDTTVPRDRLYKNYWYQSHINPVIVKDLKEIAKLVKGKSVIDIGANDGTLLKSVRKGIVTIAVEPANNFVDHYANFYINDYFENARVPIVDTICAIAMMYDLPDPNKFVKKMKDSLKEKGIIIAQLQTLSPMVELNDVGNICHEHIEYYSYASLKTLFERNGLEIYKVETNSINGGSYRIFARHFNKGSVDFQEKTYGVKELKDFFKRIEKNKRDFIKWVKSKYFEGNVALVGFGASTKMQTITQYYGCTPQMIVDINPDKAGKRTVMGALVVSKIPVWTTHFWVFPYGFLDYFKKKEKGYKGKWITTIPEFKIL